MSSVNYNYTKKAWAVLTANVTSYDIMLKDNMGTVFSVIPTIPDNITTGVCIAYETISNIDLFWLPLFAQGGVATMNEFGIVTEYVLDFDQAFAATWSSVKKIATNPTSIVLLIDDALGQDWVFVYAKSTLKDITPVPVKYFRVHSSLNTKVDAMTLTEFELVLVGKYSQNSNSTLVPTLNRYSLDGTLVENTTLGVSQSGILNNTSQIQSVKYFVNNNIRNLGILYSTGTTGINLVEHTHQFRAGDEQRADLELFVGKLYKDTDGWNSNKSMLSEQIKLQDSLVWQDFSLGIEVNDTTNNYMDTFIEKVGTTGFKYTGHYQVIVPDGARNIQTASIQEIETV